MDYKESFNAAQEAFNSLAQVSDMAGALKTGLSDQNYGLVKIVTSCMAEKITSALRNIESIRDSELN